MITIPGEYEISNTEYHAHPAIGSSGLKYFLSDCPAKFEDWRKRTSGTEGVTKEEFTFGSAYHLRMLEPHKFHADVVEQPEDMVRRGPSWEKFFIRNAKKHILKYGETATIESMADAWNRPEHSKAFELLSGPGPVEKSWFWNENGAMCKIRLDKFRPDLGMIIDLKSAVSAGFNHFSRSVRQYAYDLSAVWYKRGMLWHYDQDFDFVWIVQEKTEPYRIAVYRLSEMSFEQGLEKVDRAFGLYCECIKSGEFPGYPNEIVDL